jgi:glycosyltransferase involved in cell wall biosynthesis
MSINQDEVKVSIITPLYNRQDFIIKTAESVLAQEYQNWEWIIVDDGSTDESIHIVENYAENDQRIKVYQRNRLPKGASTSRNIGLESANGEYIIFLDSDDYLLPHCLKQRVRVALENQKMDFCLFQNILKDQSDVNPLKLWNVVTEEEVFSRFLKHDALWCICNPMYKQDFIKKYRFDESLSSWQDYELHIRILLDKPKFEVFYNLPPDLVILTHESEGRISNKLKASSHVIAHVKVLENFLYIIKQTKEYEKYRFILLKRFFEQAEYLWDVVDDIENAKKIIKDIKKYNITTNLNYIRIVAYFKVKHFVFFGKMPSFIRIRLRAFSFSILPKKIKEKFNILIGKVDYKKENYQQI